LSAAQLRKAERDFRRMLARKFSAVWIAKNERDLLAQASLEYTEWVQKHGAPHSPVGWLVISAYRRAVELLATQNRRPSSTSLEAVFHLLDESAPAPEQQTLEKERRLALGKALGHLPEKERRLLALVYFEGLSVREAGRRLGWQKSAADRHHRAAIEKLRALVGDRTLLSPASIGLAAWLATRAEGVQTALAVAGREAAASALHRIAELWRRLISLAEPGNAPALGGAARSAGFCAAAAGAVACGLGAAGVLGPSLGAVQAERALPPPAAAHKSAARLSPARPTLERGQASEEAAEPLGTPRAQLSRASATGQPAREAHGADRESAPPASGRDTVSEFGVERGSSAGAEPVPKPDSPGSEAPAASSSPASAPAAPKRAPDSSSPEFGM